MKRISVTPLKTVNGVNFGDTRASVRKEFGKYKEFKKTKSSSTTADDFGWCHAFYDSNNKLEAVELFIAECRIIVGSTNVDTGSLDSAKKSLGMTGTTDKKRSIGISESDGKLSSILFGKSGYYNGEKSSSGKKDEVIKESMGDIPRPGAPGGPPEGAVRGPLSSPAGEDLMQFYDNLKSQLNSNPAGTPAGPGPGMIHVGPNHMGHPHPGAQAFRNKAGIECEKLKDKCAKHLIVDIYLKVLPLDPGYVIGNRGTLTGDVDNMLASKNMTASQYLTSCSEKTKAPLLEFVMRSIDNIGKAFMEEAKDKLEDAQEQDIDIPAPEAPEPEESEDVATQLVDVKKDTEYENFIDKLKEKTIKKIVSDVSKIIADKKEENEMTFDPQPGGTDAAPPTDLGGDAPAMEESTTSVAIDFLQSKLMTENVSLTSTQQDEMIGMAIREATLNEINRCFAQPDTDLRPFSTRVRMGRGYVISESAAAAFLESVKQ